MTNLNRRDFLKMAGVTSAVGAAAASVAVAVPSIAEASYDSPANTAISLAVTELDTPPYDLAPYADGSKLERVDSSTIAFNNPILHAEVAPELPNALAMVMITSIAKSLAGEEGYSLRDLSVSVAANLHQSGIMDWGINFSNTFQTIVDAQGPWDKGEVQNALTIKKAAALLGSGATGICEINEKWLYQNVAAMPVPDIIPAIEYSDTAETIAITEDKYIIPKSVNRAIVVLIPLNESLLKFVPTGFNVMNGMGYSQMAEVIEKIAYAIRYMGYTAIPCNNDIALSIPLAIDAGLGELGRHGLLINPEYGTGVKICKILTDMPLAVDKPITFGAAEFCKTCKKCAELCPSKSISLDEEPSYDTYAMGNNAGMKKWYVNVDSCFKYWCEAGQTGCNICAGACTYTKPQTWVHDIIKVVTSKTTVFNSIFATMDDAFGYGTTFDQLEPGALEEWWADESFTRTYDWIRHTF